MAKMKQLDIHIQEISGNNQEYEELSIEINSYLHGRKSFEELSEKAKRLINDFKN